MLKNFIVFLFILFSLPVTAENLNATNHYYPFLAQGFDINSYQQCKDLLNKCPVENFLPTQGCIKQILGTKKACIQLGKISQILTNIPIAKQVKAFTVFDSSHIGDGQHEYYILSKGNLFTTAIDPRLLDKDFASKYKQASFFIVNWSEPSYSVNADGSQKFTALLRITKDCLACPIIGWATLGFNFTKEGALLGIKLDHFKSGSKPPI